MFLGLSEGEERLVSQPTLQPGGEQRHLPQVSTETAPQLHSLLKSRSQNIHLQRAREDGRTMRRFTYFIDFIASQFHISILFFSLCSGAAAMSAVSRRGLHLAQILTNVPDGFGLR